MWQSRTKEEQEKKKREKKLKELYTRYNQCRDAELDRFWKNSVFVWVFLALCFTALGILIFDHYTQYKCQKLHRGLSEDDYYFLSLIISVFGFVLSNIWVWMARGLKAWYEVFEMAIWQLETKDNVFEYPNEYTISNYWVIKGKVNPLQEALVSSAPISTSKIVVLIGRLLVVIWFIILIYFFFKFTNPVIWSSESWKYYREIYGCKVLWKAFNVWFWLFLIGVPTVVFFSKLIVQSSSLLTDGEKEIRNLLEKEIQNILEKKNKVTITQEDAYRFVFQNTYETIENKIKKCISFVATKNDYPLTTEIKNDIYRNILKKIADLNDYGIVNEVSVALSLKNRLKYSLKTSIIRFLCYRRYNIDIKIDNTHTQLINLDKDFDCLKTNVKSKYFTIRKVKKVNEKRIKVRCRAIHWFRDLFNCDIYNLHDDEL